MENLKSLQQGGSQQVRNNMQYLLSELQDKIQNQNIDVIQSVNDLVTEGNNPQEIAMALMQIGYDENTIKQIFQNIQASQQQEEQEIKEVATEQEATESQPETQQERVKQLEQEGMTAKKGKQVKARKGGDFKNWMNRNFGYINDNDKYDVPARFRYLPTGINRNSGLDFITDMFNVGKRAAGVVKDAISRKNDPSYNKYSIKFGKDANPEDYYITDQSLYEASQNNGDLITKDQAKQMMKDKSKFFYNPENKAYSYAIATNPFASESEMQKQINREMGKNYRDKYKQMSLSDYEKTMNLFKSFIPSFAPRNKTTTASTSNSNTSNSTEPIKGETQDSYNKRVNGMETYSANTYIWDGSKWVSRKQLGGGTHNTYYGPKKLPKAQILGEFNEDELLDRSTFYTNAFQPKENFVYPVGPPEFDYNTLYQDDYTPANLQQSPKLQDDDFGFKDEFTNTQKDSAAKVNIKNRGAFSKAFDTVTDVAGVAVDAGRSINKLLEDAENLKKYNEIVYGSADEQFGTDIGSKGYYTYQQEGILQPNMQTEYITQKGREMNNNRYKDYMMQYGGLPKAQYQNSQVKSDNTRVNQMSEADIQAYVNMMNTARDEETFFKHFPHLRNLKKMPVRDPALQDRDTNVVIKDGMAYYPKYATDYVEGEEGSGDNRGFVKDYLDPKWKGKRSMIPYFEVGSDPNSVSLMRKFQNSNLPFDFGNAFPRGYVDVEEYLQNISPVGRKMKMGGMNPMYEFFEDNDLPIYQTTGSFDGIDLSAYPKDEDGLIILNNIPDLKTMRAAAKYNQGVKGFVSSNLGKPQVEYYRTQDRKTTKANDISTGPLSEEIAKYYSKDYNRQMQLDSIPGVTSGPRYTGYTGSMFKEDLPKNQEGKEFVEKELGDPNQVVYRNDNLIDKRYNVNPFYKPTPQELQAINEYYYALFEQDKKLKEKPGITSGPRPSRDFREALSRPYGERKYGGMSNPFSNKRKLRKKRGGQIARISTDVLKRLQEEANKDNTYKFDVL